MIVLIEGGIHIFDNLTEFFGNKIVLDNDAIVYIVIGFIFIQIKSGEKDLLKESNS
jgi:hypothetical protein